MAIKAFTRKCILHLPLEIVMGSCITHISLCKSWSGGAAEQVHPLNLIAIAVRSSIVMQLPVACRLPCGAHLFWIYLLHVRHLDLPAHLQLPARA